MPKTLIYKQTAYGEQQIGHLENGVIYGSNGQIVGRYDEHGYIFQATTHDERELGYFTPQGQIHSHGLFEGGELGWLESDGVVIQAGLILGEEEVGRVEGPTMAAAAAALLLLLLPGDAEANRRLKQR